MIVIYNFTIWIILFYCFIIIDKKYIEKEKNNFIQILILLNIFIHYFLIGLFLYIYDSIFLFSIINYLISSIIVHEFRYIIKDIFFIYYLYIIYF